MKKINPFGEKSLILYKDFATKAALMSVAKKRQVGCVVVTTTGMIGVGWNGMPSGFPNSCETFLGGDIEDMSNWKTKPEVVHAERNALDKLSREGIIPEGSMCFVTTAPCIECAKSIAAVGIDTVYYRDAYKNEIGIDFLETAGVKVLTF